jgi:hypothetical protein
VLNKKMISALILGIGLTTLSGCSNKVDELVEQGTSAVNKVKEAGSKANEVTTALNVKIQAVKKARVYEDDFTFEELFNGTLDNRKWKADKDKNEVQVTGTFKEFFFKPVFTGNTESAKEQQKILNELLMDKSTTYTAVFPFMGDTDVPLITMPAFSEVNAFIKSDGREYEVNGQLFLSILSEAFILKNKDNSKANK